MKLHKVAWVLVIIGALNWGLVGLLDLNVVTEVFGTGTLTNVIYDLVGLSALYLIFNRRG
ncbi:MAG: DUF378 domain-containing protein [Candidatus Yanofskybacteria bacterium RIFCSPHIGHO2_02_FULL_50_12]|uniref:DUF378 domain-containing protein n=1 Tax=Candidatus Yanofskybacteria bacterium RIFCSPHIGHO2_02_FULL_50_12 TaxID=1802685 RepID=A0A1F8FVQ3_9BACT|nr:MAG: DUF378 domain-containing protein [Candidatus Yanofskybacteria bacterium RIFCSPHIGHO2_02_FULL_50_12]